MPRVGIVTGIAAVVVASTMLSGCADSTEKAATPSSCSSSSASSSRADALSLPRPTGQHAVGTRDIDLVDTSRTDPIAPTKQDRRLAVRLWYPAKKAPMGCSGTSAYADPAAATAYAKSLSLPTGALDGIRSPAIAKAPVAPGRHPLALYSHGLFGALTDNTAAALQLASHGYVVAGIGTTYESPAVRFRDGTLVKQGKKATANITEGRVEPQIDLRAKDAEFVLTSLTGGGKAVPASITAAIDPKRVGMFGHSAGGAASLQVAQEEPSVRVAVNLDGFARQPNATTGITKPYLFVASEGHLPATEKTWPPFIKASSGAGTLVELRGAGHLALTDMGNDGWIESFGLKGKIPDEAYETNFGDVPKGTGAAVAAMITAFFDKTLRDGSPTAFDQVVEGVDANVRSTSRLG